MGKRKKKMMGVGDQVGVVPEGHHLLRRDGFDLVVAKKPGPHCDGVCERNGQCGWSTKERQIKELYCGTANCLQ